MKLKYTSIYAFNTIQIENISNCRLDYVLHSIYEFVDKIITEPLCTSHVYGSKILDRLCYQVGNSNLSFLRKALLSRTTERKQSIYVYIVTKLQKSGGHSRVIADFIKSKPDTKHILLSTELSGRSDFDYFESSFQQPIQFSFEQAPKGHYQKRLTWLQERLLEIRPDKTFLFNHHQDSVAAAAIQPEMGLNAYFYHHGDHHLCLGVYLSHLKHIDPHPMGYHNCRDNLGIENIYIPLTVDDKGTRPSDWPFLNSGCPTTCTAARSNKVEIPYFVSYLDMVPQIAAATGGRHIHIGRLSPWALRRIRQGLKRRGIPSDRFEYIPWVPSVWRALHEHRVDLYIASFPYGGGLTLIEAMGAGVPVALHKHIFSRLLSCIDLSYPGAFSWRSPEELLAFCSNLTPQYLEAQSRAGRSHYEKFHRREILEEILRSENDDLVQPLPLSEPFLAESDEWACWMERQVSLERIIRRAIYRFGRSVRARLS